MSNPYLSELRMVSFNFPPKGWAFSNGQVLTINQNQALFALLGTTYGGNGQTTFQLPNLQSRTPIHTGQHVLGEMGGNEVALTPSTTSITVTGAAANGGTSYVGYTPSQSLFSTMSPYLVLNYVIALVGIFPSQN